MSKLLNKKILLLPLAIVLTAFLATGVSAALAFDTPDASFQEDSTSSVDLDGYVSGAVGGVTFSVFAQGTHTKAAIDATTHVVTYTADANWNGQESITILAQDTMSNVPDVIKVTVASVNDAPVLATMAQQKAYFGTQFSYQINASDPDVVTNGDILTYTADAHGWTTFSMSSSGLVQFTPTEDDEGYHAITITVKDTAGLTVTGELKILVTETNDDGTLQIKSVELNDATGDDSEIAPGDYLEVDFDIDNTKTKDMTDVKATAWIENSEGTRLGSKVSTTEDDLDSNDARSETLKLRVEPTAKEATYTLYIQAEGTDEDDLDKTGLYAEQIKVERNSHELLIENLAISPEAPVCGGKAEVKAMLYNIGSTSEDVKFRVRNTALGIDVYSPEFELRTSGSSAKAEKMVIVDIPALAKGSYTLEVSAIFDGGSDSVSQTISMPVTCGSTIGTTTITGAVTQATISLPVTSASAESGQSVKFTATIKNTEATAQTYQIALSGTTDWAAANVEPADVTLAPGAEIPVYVYLTPKSGVYGDQAATLSVKSGTTILATKSLTVSMPQKPTTTVTPKTSSTTSPLAGIELSEEAKLAIIVGIIIIAGGFVFMKYKASQGVKVYGNKKGKGKSFEDEEA